MESKGTSQLAMLADTLPVRARACLALLLADLGLQHLQSSTEFKLAQDAMTLALKWYNGEPVDVEVLDDMLEGEDPSISYAAMMAQAHSEKEALAWRLFGNALSYVIYRAYRLANLPMRNSLGAVDETIFDDLDRDLRELVPSSLPLVSRAAAYLKQHPNASFAQLKAQVSKPR